MGTAGGHDGSKARDKVLEQEAPLEAQGSSLRASVPSTTTGEPLKGKAQLPRLALARVSNSLRKITSFQDTVTQNIYVGVCHS